MKLRDKLDEITQQQADQNATLVRLTVTVEEHVRRTNLLEEEFKPVKKHVDLINSLAKIFCAAAGAGAAIAAIVSLIRH